MTDTGNKNFALIGASGFVAPRHMRAIKETGNELLAACDPYDGVGIMDSYFPDTAFFTEFERFDRHVEKLKQRDNPIDYFSICSPNYLHDAHVRFALRYGAHAICEKPLVLNPWNLDALEQLESEYPGKIFNVLQLRLHPAIIQLKKDIENNPPAQKKKIDLTYITSRGKWYYASWKGDIRKSGGVATNIGIHFFDMLMWVFGGVDKMEVHRNTHDSAAGFLELKNAEVRWFMSINSDHLPTAQKQNGKRTYRSLSMDGNEIDFTSGFEDLHTETYRKVLNGNGFSISETRPSIELVHKIRFSDLTSSEENAHPLNDLPLGKHPFG